MFDRLFQSDKLIWWIICVAFLLRLIVIPILGPDNEDLYEYGQIAWNIVQGHGFSWDFEGRFPLQPTAYSPALYCYTLVPWFALFGIELTGPRIMHALLLAAACWFLFKIGQSLVNRRVGLIAASIWAIYPELIFLTVRFAPENAMFLPMMALLYVVQKLPDSGGNKSTFGCGMLLGIACWVNPSLQILGAIVPASWLLNRRVGVRAWLKSSAILAAGAILVIAPWTIRNYVKLGAFVPLRSAFAYNVWRGNHIGATGTVRTFDGNIVDVAVPPEYKEYYEKYMVSDEIERDRFFAGEVKTFIRENPGEYLKLTTIRFYYFWWRDFTHPLTSHPLYIVPWILILIFASIGMISILPQWRLWSLWWLQIIGFTVLFSLTIFLPRYRMPIYPAMFLLAATGIDRMIVYLKAGGKAKLE